MTKKNDKNIEFQIKAIEVLDSCLNTPNKPIEKNAIFKFDISLEHKLNVENKLVVVLCSISILSETTEELYGKIRTSCIYDVPNFEIFYDSETKETKFPDEFIHTLNSITISTNRGVMVSYFKGTFLNNTILPIIDPKGFKIEKLPQ